MFDNIADLIDKIRLGEDSYLELKEVRFAGQKVSAPHKDSLADELAAFANSLASGVPMANILFAGASVGMMVMPLMLFSASSRLRGRWSSITWAATTLIVWGISSTGVSLRMIEAVGSGW